jgi:hypothetical protein
MRAQASVKNLGCAAARRRPTRRRAATRRSLRSVPFWWRAQRVARLQITPTMGTRHRRPRVDPIARSPVLAPFLHCGIRARPGGRVGESWDAEQGIQHHVRGAGRFALLVELEPTRRIVLDCYARTARFQTCASGGQFDPAPALGLRPPVHRFAWLGRSSASAERSLPHVERSTAEAGPRWSARSPYRPRAHARSTRTSTTSIRTSAAMIALSVLLRDRSGRCPLRPPGGLAAVAMGGVPSTSRSMPPSVLRREVQSVTHGNGAH